MVSSKQQSAKKKLIRTSIRASATKLDKFIKPMLAKEVDEPFDGKDWLYEIKWDGYRAICEIDNGKVTLYSRNGISFNTSYPVIINELKKIKQNVVLDGEVVVLNEEGRSDFQKLQHYEDNTNFPLCYCVFDLLRLNGEDTKALPLTDRKKLLKQLLKSNPVIRYSDHILYNGKDFFNVAKKKGLEGIMAKKISSQYHTGTRTSEWLKIKQHKSEEVMIVGFTEPTGARKYFGALVLAVRSGKGLKYAGHTGSGFSDQLLKEVYSKLKPLITKQSPFEEVVKTNMPVTWVRPKYVCEIEFTEWTNDGKMRHPIFLRMREDKSIKDVIMKKASTSEEKKSETEQDENERELLIGKVKVKLTNQNKLYWPKEKITKGMMIDYYQSMAEYILPYLKDRPESLKRNPNGIADSGFFHKDAGEDAPPWVKSKALYSESTKKEIDYIICNDSATLAYLNNLGCIELNPWNSTTKALDKPDYMIIDIDPSAKNNFNQVVETALAFKEIFDKAGAPCYCKTSGATGLHIYIPMGKKYTYEQVKDFAALTCTMVNEVLPKFTSMERNLAKRGNKIYLDHLQNRRGQTVAAVYSVRPQPGATVSTPLEWKEVKEGLDPSVFNINSVPLRVKKIKDIFIPVLGTGIDMKKCLDKLYV